MPAPLAHAEVARRKVPRAASKAAGREEGRMPEVSIESVSLVIPAWNEAASLPTTAREAMGALQRIARRWELVVVDDGSSDGTAEVVGALAEADPRVRLVRHARNLGYAVALRAGFASCREELVAFTDADGQLDVGDLAALHALLAAGADIAAGVRARRKDPWFRRFASWVYNRLADALVGTRALDIDCALKLFPRGLVESLGLRSPGFLFNAELFGRARLAGLRVAQAPVAHRPRRAGRSTVRLSAVGETVAGLLRLASELRREETTAWRPAGADPLPR
jgi:glycosyltransferase involved in cell wall biosynthesis